MDSHQPMMESHGDLIDRVSVMFDPISSISKEIVRLLRDRLWRPTNVLERPAKLAGPLPRVRKHLTMELSQKVHVENGPTVLLHS
jgi:hypothetical protein